MFIREILTEGLSPIVYHYTNINAALKIVESGVFELSSALGSIEEKYAPPGYPYFLSTTRTKTGDYHGVIGSSAVLFVLDGTWYNQRYSARSVDYWLNRDSAKSYGRPHEAEDRLFSKTPTIPISGVIGVHVLLKDKYPKSKYVSWVRKVLINSKRRGISTYFYTDERAWRRLDTTKTDSINVLKRIDSARRNPYVSSSLGYLHPVLELIGAQKENQLSIKANSIKYTIRYNWDNPNVLKDIAHGFVNDFSNARKPDSGPDRKNLTKIIAFMRQHKLNTIYDLVNWLANKWKDR